MKTKRKPAPKVGSSAEMLCENAKVSQSETKPTTPENQ